MASNREIESQVTLTVKNNVNSASICSAQGGQIVSLTLDDVKKILTPVSNSSSAIIAKAISAKPDESPKVLASSLPTAPTTTLTTIKATVKPVKDDLKAAVSAKPDESPKVLASSLPTASTTTLTSIKATVEPAIDDSKLYPATPELMAKLKQHRDEAFQQLLKSGFFGGSRPIQFGAFEATDEGTLILGKSIIKSAPSKK